MSGMVSSDVDMSSPQKCVVIGAKRLRSESRSPQKDSPQKRSRIATERPPPLFHRPLSGVASLLVSDLESFTIYTADDYPAHAHAADAGLPLGVAFVEVVVVRLDGIDFELHIRASFPSVTPFKTCPVLDLILACWSEDSLARRPRWVEERAPGSRSIAIFPYATALQVLQEIVQAPINKGKTVNVQRFLARLALMDGFSLALNMVLQEFCLSRDWYLELVREAHAGKGELHEEIEGLYRRRILSTAADCGLHEDGLQWGRFDNWLFFQIDAMIDSFIAKFNEALPDGHKIVVAGESEDDDMDPESDPERNQVGLDDDMPSP